MVAPNYGRNVEEQPLLHIISRRTCYARHIMSRLQLASFRAENAASPEPIGARGVHVFHHERNVHGVQADFWREILAYIPLHKG